MITNLCGALKPIPEFSQNAVIEIVWKNTFIIEIERFFLHSTLNINSNIFVRPNFQKIYLVFFKYDSNTKIPYNKVSKSQNS